MQDRRILTASDLEADGWVKGEDLQVGDIITQVCPTPRLTLYNNSAESTNQDPDVVFEVDINTPTIQELQDMFLQYPYTLHTDRYVSVSQTYNTQFDFKWKHNKSTTMNSSIFPILECGSLQLRMKCVFLSYDINTSLSATVIPGDINRASFASRIVSGDNPLKINIDGNIRYSPYYVIQDENLVGSTSAKLSFGVNEFPLSIGQSGDIILARVDQNVYSNSQLSNSVYISNRYCFVATKGYIIKSITMLKESAQNWYFKVINR